MSRTKTTRTFVKTLTALNIKGNARCTRRMIKKAIHDGDEKMQMKGRRITKKGMNNRQLISVGACWQILAAASSYVNGEFVTGDLKLAEQVIVSMKRDDGC
ncbi:hypothetical protein PanWU01x14_164370 [Parasponia andersonii]|uniref:Uncharacterized protein n=1 Tax=Parasponia andersonii TaxID=3476 RepID=A0A2P5CCE8_PARAD|nr:hypothetical protein PanWU01x14_164370 [Parasponia andersonii]